MSLRPFHLDEAAHRFVYLSSGGVTVFSSLSSVIFPSGIVEPFASVDTAGCRSSNCQSSVYHF